MPLERGRSYRIVTNPVKEVDEDMGSYADQPVVRRRAKPIGGGVGSARSLKSGRRISCADLGHGTFHGWLRTRKPRKKTWEACHKWCVIKDGDLYVYASKMDTTATSRIHLPMFTVSEAKETKKTGAFKVQNSGTTFYFRSKTDEEKYQWINHLSLTAIGYKPSDSRTMVTGSTASSSGISSSYSVGRSYSDEEETDSSSVCEEPAVTVTVRPKKPSSFHPTRLKSHIDVNRDLRRMVTSIRDADLDIVGTDKDSRRQSQLRKSLAHAGFSRKHSSKNKRLFILRAKERHKQGLEQELADINDLLANASRLKLHEFLARYPDYDDGISLDSVIETSDQSSSARSSNDIEEVLNSIGSSNTVVCDTDTIDTADTTCTPLSEPYNSTSAHDRHTLTADFDLSKLLAHDLDTLTLDATRLSSSASSMGSKESVFNKQKYKQTVTHL